MSNLSDLFVSYKIVEEPTITTPQYNPAFVPETMITQGNFASKVENIKARIQESPAFKGWSTGGVKEKEYTSSNYVELPKKEKETLTWTSPSDKASWKSQLYSAYKRAGCSDTFARNLIGQDALETGWGKHTVGDFNYGNIKAGKSWQGRSKKAHDKREKSNDAYRSYDSIDHYVQDKLRLLQDKYGMTGNETPEQFTDKLIAGGYATSKTYKENVLRTIKSV